jgi:hypothetical protein
MVKSDRLSRKPVENEIQNCVLKATVMKNAKRRVRAEEQNREIVKTCRSKMQEKWELAKKEGDE